MDVFIALLPLHLLGLVQRILLGKRKYNSQLVALSHKCHKCVLTRFIYIFFCTISSAVKEFLETAKEEFEEKWKNPKRVSH